MKPAESTLRERKWAGALCILATFLYTLVAPLVLLLGVAASVYENYQAFEFLLLLSAFPISLSISLAVAWYSYGTGAYRRARLFCLVPGLVLLLYGLLATLS